MDSSFVHPHLWGKIETNLCRKKKYFCKFCGNILEESDNLFNFANRNVNINILTT